MSLRCSRRGGDALKKIEQSNYDLIILDITLPDISGLQVCKQLRDQDNKTPIIMLTSRSDESDKVLALEMGADDYITKPRWCAGTDCKNEGSFMRTEFAGNR